MEHRRTSIACKTAAVPPTPDSWSPVSEGLCVGPLGFHYAKLNVTYCIPSVIGLC
jgi:hypothetical protein